MNRNPAEDLRLLQEHYRRAKSLDSSARRAYVRELRDQDRELADRLARMLDVSDEATSAALPDLSTVAPERRGGVAVGDDVAGFRVLAEIGSGGMGTVYRAQQQTPRREVALKMMSRGLASKSSLQRFRLEAEILGSLAHDGIASVYEAGVHKSGGEVPYLAMEFIDGQPLSQWIERHRPDLDARIELVASIARAIEHAHQRGIIHRDLKPANILVTEDGRPKVIDFGVARARDADIHLTTLHTEAGAVIGTMSYMSPEQLAGDPAQVDTRTDVYALGVVLYELLTGDLPLDLRQKSLHEAFLLVVERRPRPIGDCDRSLRGDLELIVQTALEKDRELRYGSASAFADDLDRYRAGEAIQARPPSRGYLLKKFVRRNRLAVIGSILLLLAIVGGAIGTGIGMSRANEALSQKVEEERKGRLAAEEAQRRGEQHERVVDFYYAAFSRIDQTVGTPPQTYADFLDILSERIDADMGADQLAEARIRSAIGQAYVGLAKSEPASKHLVRAIELERAVGGDASLAFAHLVRTLARCSMMKTEYEQSERGFDEAGAIYERFDELDGRIGKMRCVLGVAQIRGITGRNPESIVLLREALAMARAEGEATAGWVPIIIDRLVRELLHRKDYDEVEGLLTEGEQAAIVAHGEGDHLVVAGLLGLRALRETHHRRYQEAEAMQREALAMAERAVGHDAAVREFDNMQLARIIVARRRYPDAIAYLENLRDEQVRLDVHEYQLSRTVDYLGRIQAQIGQFDDAITNVMQAIEIRRRVFPNGSSATGESLRHAARIQMARGKNDEAEQLFVEAVPILEQANRPHSVLSMIGALYQLRLAAGDSEQAMKYKQRELALTREIHPAGSAPVAAADAWEAGTLFDNGDAATARELLDHAMPVLRASEKRPFVLVMYETLYVKVLERLDARDEAIAALELAAARAVAAKDVASPNRAFAVDAVHVCDERLGKPAALVEFRGAFPK